VLASSELVVSDDTGVAYNDDIMIFCPDVKFDQLGLDPVHNILEILSPSPLAGSYQISEPCKNKAIISGIP
jgi:hypothetical protein